MLERRALFPVLALALIVLGCKDDDDGGTGPGSSARTFQATITGGVSTTLSGIATFGDGILTPAGAGWGLTLTHGDENGMGIMIGRLSTRPGEGTHAIVDLSDYDETPADVIFAVFIYQQGQNLGTFVSTGGELTITQSSANRMQGTFQLLAAGTLMEGGGVRDVTVVISGSFDAGAA